VIFAKKRVKKSKYFSNRRRLILKKSVFLLPNIFTLGNAFFGFCSIIFASKSDFFTASYFILLGALMDSLDGRIARHFGSSSAIGLQLDSLADAVSFCLAPAFLIYFWHFKSLGFLGLIISSVFFLAGIFRLARFNVISHEQSLFFLGLPTTIAGCFLSTFYLNIANKYSERLILPIVFLLCLFLSYLMVSKIKFPAFKQNFLKPYKRWYKFLLICLFAFSFVMQFHKTLILLFVLYFFSSIYFNFKLKFEHKVL